MNSNTGPTLAMSNIRGNSVRQHSIYFQSPIEVIDLTDSPPQPHPRPAQRHHHSKLSSSRDVIDVDSPPPPRQPSYSLPLPHLRQHPIFLPGEDITRNIDDIISLGDFNDKTSPPTSATPTPTTN